MSFSIHFVLLVFSGGSWDSGGAEGLARGAYDPSVAKLSRSAPAFLTVYLAEEHRPTPSTRPETEQSFPLPDESKADTTVNIKSITAGTSQLFGTDRPSETSASKVEGDAAQGRRLADNNFASEEAALLARRAGYTLTNLLDVSPYPLDDIKPEYPDTAGNQQGKVVLRLYISENGDVDELVVVRAAPRGLFEEAALAAFAKGRFSPGMKTGRAVKSQLAVEIEFVPFDRGAAVSGHSY